MIDVVPDLVRLVTAVVLSEERALQAFAAEHADRADDVGLREALLQAHLFCGFPRTLAALDALRAAGLILAPGAAPQAHGAAGDDEGLAPESVRARGAALFDRIYAEGADGVRAHLEALDPTFASWIADHAYGRVLSRPGLDAGSRELLAVAALAATGHERQLASHVRGAVRCGASAADVEATVDAIASLVRPERLDRARHVVARFARPEA
ncbi:MAG: carboxymuconolactone decarboxylase family protein [Planctomycetota bacterium]